ncbi:hypothetical protein BOG92_001435 [Streptomyces sp. WAC00263]|nr:hypothetical protein BOG92_001435 [Streptomyces sp. WAC00263]
MVGADREREDADVISAFMTAVVETQVAVDLHRFVATTSNAERPASAMVLSPSRCASVMAPMMPGRPSL